MAKIAGREKRYASVLMDEEWDRIAPLMPEPGRRGRPREIAFREVINVVRYLARSGCGWRMLPAHFGHWRTVYGWFRELARRFLFQAIHDVELMLDRKYAGGEARPSAAIRDSQSVKAPHAKARGYDAVKRIVGCKRHIAVDADGRLMMVNLTSADVAGSTGAQAILEAIRCRWPWVKHLFADATNDRLKLMGKVAYLEFVVEIIRRPDQQRGLAAQPRRWVVERTFSWMVHWRRLVRDDGHRIDVSRAMNHVVMGGILLRRNAHPWIFKRTPSVDQGAPRGLGRLCPTRRAVSSFSRGRRRFLSHHLPLSTAFTHGVAPPPMIGCDHRS